MAFRRGREEVEQFVKFVVGLTVFYLILKRFIKEGFM